MQINIKDIIKRINNNYFSEITLKCLEENIDIRYTIEKGKSSHIKRLFHRMNLDVIIYLYNNNESFDVSLGMNYIARMSNTSDGVISYLIKKLKNKKLLIHIMHYNKVVEVLEHKADLLISDMKLIQRMFAYYNITAIFALFLSIENLKYLEGIEDDETNRNISKRFYEYNLSLI